jgi:hypothetical protein
MAKLVLDNVTFDFDLGCKIAKLKYDECPEQFKALEDFWNDIVPANFSDIAQLPNLEQRRIGIKALGLERLIKEVKPKLINSTTLKKSNSWVNENGMLETFEFEDTYELFEVKGEVFNQGLESWQKMQDCHYIKCKDTSTDREYLIWVDLRRVYDTNKDKFGRDWYQAEKHNKKINAIQCIAWTITTNIPKGHIAEIHRQGDCIMILPMGEYETLNVARHLTEQEYRELIVNES